jgi:hypothetical protein
MNYGVKMSSCSMIYVPCFIKISSAIQKMLGGDTITDARRTR